MDNNVRVCFIALLSLASCTKNDVNRTPIADVRISDMPEFKGIVLINISNMSNDMLCVSADQIDPTFVNLAIFQNGKRVYSQLSVNRKFKEFNSLNALAPIYLIPPGGRMFEYNTSDFPLEHGKINIRGKIKVATCPSIFGSKQPNWKILAVSGNVDF